MLFLTIFSFQSKFSDSFIGFFFFFWKIFFVGFVNFFDLFVVFGRICYTGVED